MVKKRNKHSKRGKKKEDRRIEVSPPMPIPKVIKKASTDSSSREETPTTPSDPMSSEMNEHVLNPELKNLTDGIHNLSLKDDAAAVVNIQMSVNQEWIRIICCCGKSHRVLLTSSKELIFQITRDNGSVNFEVSQETIKIFCSCGVGHQIHSSANSKPSYKILK